MVDVVARMLVLTDSTGRGKKNSRFYPAWFIGMILESIVAPSQCCRRPISSNGVPQRLPLVL